MTNHACFTGQRITTLPTVSALHLNKTDCLSQSHFFIVTCIDILSKTCCKIACVCQPGMHERGRGRKRLLHVRGSGVKCRDCNKEEGLCVVTGVGVSGRWGLGCV